MLLLLFQLSLTSAEFLAPVNEPVDNSTLPGFCFEEEAISCTLVRPDPDALLSSSLGMADVVLEFLDQPSNNTFTFTTEDGDEATFTTDEESGEIWGNAEMADGRDFVLEPSPDSCKGCHAWIEENRSAFPTQGLLHTRGEEEGAQPSNNGGQRDGENQPWVHQQHWL